MVLTVVGTTYLAVLRIAEHKADALAGGGTFRLDQASSSEGRTFEALLEQLRRWNEADLASTLLALQQDGHLWVAPHLAGQRSAIFVSALGLVSRIYVRRDELVDRTLPFPDIGAPDMAQRQFATIRLAGTLYHELQHYEGLEDEGATYDREIAWYRALRAPALRGLEGERARWCEWAIDSAVESALAARETATGKLAPTT
jgi:hypothetical protein